MSLTLVPDPHPFSHREYLDHPIAKLEHKHNLIATYPLLYLQKKSKKPRVKVVYPRARTSTSKLPKRFHFPSTAKLQRITPENPGEPPEFRE